MPKSNIDVENKHNILVKYELSCVQFHLNSHPLHAFKGQERGLFQVGRSLTSRFFSNRRIKIPGLKGFHRRWARRGSHADAEGEGRAYLTRAKFSAQNQPGDNFHSFSYIHTQTLTLTHTHVCVHISHAFGHTEDQRENGTGKTRISQLQSFLGTRFLAKFCSSGRVRMSAEDLKNHRSLRTSIPSLPPSVPSHTGPPPSLIRTRVVFCPAGRLPLTSSPIKSEKLDFSCGRFQLLKKINWNERPFCSFFFSLGKLPLRLQEYSMQLF